MPDGHWRNRLGLALAMLEGDKDAHKILGDLLEEAGERGLAQWARSPKKGKTSKRMDFVFAILPHELVAQLGCDFVDHLGAQRLGAPGTRLVRLTREVVERKEATPEWLAWDASDVRVRRSVRPCLDGLHKIGQNVLTVAWHEQCGEAGAAVNAAKSIQTETSQLARLVREAAETPDRAGSLPDRHKHADELQWQAQQVRGLLERLMQTGHDSGAGGSSPHPRASEGAD